MCHRRGIEVEEEEIEDGVTGSKAEKESANGTEGARGVEETGEEKECSMDGGSGLDVVDEVATKMGPGVK